MRISWITCVVDAALIYAVCGVYRGLEHQKINSFEPLSFVKIICWRSFYNGLYSYGF